MQLCFELSMPNRASWNGGWSGADRYYAKVISFGRTKKLKEKAQALLKKGHWYYNFGDGWGASVRAKEVSRAEAAQIKKKTDGFCGYDWMIDSIIEKGEITA